MNSKLFAARRSNSKSSVTAPLYSPDSIIKLNVGGTRYDTRLRTLLADRNGSMFNIFAPLLEARMEYKFPQKDEEGMFFLDMDPEEFRILLSNLRFISQLQGCSDDGTRSTTKESTDNDDDSRSTRSSGLWNRFLKQKSVGSS